MTVIEITEKKYDKLSEHIEESLRHLGKAMSCISEIGELEQLLLNSYHISPLIDSIKYLLELLESELELLYNQSTNRLVNFLTILSLILTVVSTAAEVMK